MGKKPTRFPLVRRKKYFHFVFKSRSASTRQRTSNIDKMFYLLDFFFTKSAITSNRSLFFSVVGASLNVGKMVCLFVCLVS